MSESFEDETRMMLRGWRPPDAPILAQSELPSSTGSTLVNDLAREAWCVLNHDNDWLDTTDPCHAANWERLTKGIRVILKAHKIKA